MAIRDTQKPNALPGTSSGGYGGDTQNDDPNVDTGGSDSPGKDNYAPPAVGATGADNEGHNSDYLKSLQLPVD